MNDVLKEIHGLEAGEGQMPAENWFERNETLQKLRKNKKFPTIWCAGCGIGIVMGALAVAIVWLGVYPQPVLDATKQTLTRLQQYAPARQAALSLDIVRAPWASPLTVGDDRGAR